MNLAASIAESFGRSFDLYRDLVDSLDEGTLAAKLPGLPSNSLGSQLWCVAGARESYTVALREKAWSGFSCSLQTTTEILPVSAALLTSAEGVRERLDSVSSFTEAQNRLLIALLEHEVAHQGAVDSLFVWFAACDSIKLEKEVCLGIGPVDLHHHPKWRLNPEP